jgi:hypothetical protein
LNRMCSRKCAVPLLAAVSKRLPELIQMPTVAVSAYGFASVATRSPLPSVVTCSSQAASASVRVGGPGAGSAPPQAAQWGPSPLISAVCCARHPAVDLLWRPGRRCTVVRAALALHTRTNARSDDPRAPGCLGLTTAAVCDLGSAGRGWRSAGTGCCSRQRPHLQRLRQRWRWCAPAAPARPASAQGSAAPASCGAGAGGVARACTRRGLLWCACAAAACAAAVCACTVVDDVARAATRRVPVRRYSSLYWALRLKAPQGRACCTCGSAKSHACCSMHRACAPSSCVQWEGLRHDHTAEAAVSHHLLLAAAPPLPAAPARLLPPLPPAAAFALPCCCCCLLATMALTCWFRNAAFSRARLAASASSLADLAAAASSRPSCVGVCVCVCVCVRVCV